MKSLFLAAILVAIPASASAQQMTVNGFLTKVAALKAKGVMALFSPDVKVLQRQVETISTDYRAEQDAARAAGRQPASCPTGPKMGRDEFLAELERIPPAQRGMSLRQGFATVMKRRYPCPAR